MNCFLRLALVLTAAAMHLLAPVAAYANVWANALPDDLCSAARSASATPARSGSPVPASHEHHCAHAPCCVGGALGASAPPPSPLAALPVALADGAYQAAIPIAAPVAPIAAAQPRGPPRRS